MSGVVVGTLLAGIRVYYFSGWSAINCWTREIDINSAQTRYRRYWFWMLTKEEISPTWMSELLDVPDKDSTVDWRLVVTLSPGTGHSSHYAYHGAIADLNTARAVFECYDVPRERRLALAKAITDSWKRTGSDSEASRLITGLLEEAIDGKYPEK